MSSKSSKIAIAPYNFDDNWNEILDNEEFVKLFLSDVLENYIVKQRWYGGKASKLKYIELAEYFRIQQDGEVYFGLILEIDFYEAFYQHYFLPIAFVTDESFADTDRILPISLKGEKGFIIDAINLEAFRKLVYYRILNALPKDETKVQYHKSIKLPLLAYESSRFMGLEQSNTSVIYNELYVLKFFRRIFADKNPDYEMSRFLTEKHSFKNTPAYLGSINVIDSDNTYITIALMQEKIENEGDAWEYMLKELHNVFMNLSHKKINISQLPKVEMFRSLKIGDVPPQIIDWVGLNLFLKVQTLAKRTAEMHIALGSEFEDTAFTPAHFNRDYEVWLKNRLIHQFQNRLNTIENNMHKLEGLALDLAKEFLDKKNEIRKRFIQFDWTKLKGERIRLHGDYHLGQILVRDNDCSRAKSDVALRMIAVPMGVDQKSYLVSAGKRLDRLADGWSRALIHGVDYEHAVRIRQDADISTVALKQVNLPGDRRECEFGLRRLRLQRRSQAKH